MATAVPARMANRGARSRPTLVWPMSTMAGFASEAAAAKAAVQVSLRYSSSPASSTTIAASAPYAIACCAAAEAPLPKATAVTLSPEAAAS